MLTRQIVDRLAPTKFVILEWSTIWHANNLTNQHFFRVDIIMVDIMTVGMLGVDIET
jgi:beta-xylosidase